MGNCFRKKKKIVRFNAPHNNNITDHQDQITQDKIIDNTVANTSHAGRKSKEYDSFEMSFGNSTELNHSHHSDLIEEAHHGKSHPLPIPDNFTIKTNYHTANLLPLPTPDTSTKFYDATDYLPAPRETSTSSISSSLGFMLPLPISESTEILLSSPHLKSFSFKELSKATLSFSEFTMLGEGGFGCVYKGWLDELTLEATRPGSGIPVAIKKLIPDGFQGHKEWLQEVKYLGLLRHPNLVKLIGYCIEGEDRILVYEYMPGGSLENHLFFKNTPFLSWTTRIKVAVGAARGLCFLHESKSPVIYRDFKASNVLLDSEFNVKLSDFGLAKAGPTESQTHVTTRIMGTEGYCDPHYCTTGKLTVKCDVYSFGVVLLELLTGRRAIEHTKCLEQKNLVQWVKLQVQNKGKIFRIMDTKLEGQYCKKSAYIAANIALRCVHHEPKYRPPMTYILEILENLPPHHNNGSSHATDV